MAQHAPFVAVDRAPLWDDLHRPSAEKSVAMEERIAIGLLGQIRPFGIGRGVPSCASWLEGARCHKGPFGPEMANISFGCYSAGRNRQHAIMKNWIRDATGMPNLHEYPATCRLDGLRNLSPAIDVVLCPNPRTAPTSHSL
jgi:hypothetical protein